MLELYFHIKCQGEWLFGDKIICLNQYATSTMHKQRNVQATIIHFRTACSFLKCKAYIVSFFHPCFPAMKQALMISNSLTSIKMVLSVSWTSLSCLFRVSISGVKLSQLWDPLLCKSHCRLWKISEKTGSNKWIRKSWKTMRQTEPFWKKRFFLTNVWSF